MAPAVGPRMLAVGMIAWRLSGRASIAPIAARAEVQPPQCDGVACAWRNPMKWTLCPLGSLLRVYLCRNVPGLLGHDRRDDVAPVAPVHSKIGVERQHDASRVLFRHPHQARICQGDRDTRIPYREPCDRGCVVREAKRDGHDIPLDHLEHPPGTVAEMANEEARFGEHGLAGEEGLDHVAHCASDRVVIHSAGAPAGRALYYHSVRKVIPRAPARRKAYNPSRFIIRYSVVRSMPSARAASARWPPAASSAARMRTATVRSSASCSVPSAAGPAPTRSSSNRSSGTIVSPRASTTARSTAFSSSRTFPGQPCAASTASASGEKASRRPASAA